MLLYLLAVVAATLFLDILRSALGLRRIAKLFKNHYATNKNTEVKTYGTGKDFHLVIMGDSTFDVRGDTKVPYGSAQLFVDRLAALYSVNVHLFAKAGAKSYDVAASQLPKLKALPKVDLVVIYMGANNAVYFKNPFTIGEDYQAILAYTESKSIPVAASQVANYWSFNLFSWVQRAWLYMAIYIENAYIRQAFKGTRYTSLVALKPIHKEIHKKRREEPYLLDGFHPNDAACITFGTIFVQEALKHPAIATLFKQK